MYVKESDSFIVGELRTWRQEKAAGTSSAGIKNSLQSLQKCAAPLCCL